MLLEELVSIGFGREEAERLARNNSFHHKNKSSQELIALFTKISNIYNCAYEEVKRAILIFPQFAGYDHERVVRQKTRLGRMAGLSEEETISYVLDMPILANYSTKRYLAVFDIARQLLNEGFSKENIMKAFFLYYPKSPYVPHSDRKRISQIANYEEPPLLKVMRKKLKKEG